MSILARLRGRFSRGLVLEARLWTWLMVIGLVLRATSYWWRPPQFTPTSARIEGVLAYPAWTTALGVVALLLVLGMTVRGAVALAWLGHALGAAVSATLASSIFLAAIFDDQAWSAGWPLVVVAVVHIGRANYLGPKVRRRVARARP